jgi:hypothetical protein
MKLAGWLVRLAAWLPVCLVAWYYAAPMADQLLAWGSRAVVNLAANDVVSGTETGSGPITFVTRLKSGGGIVTIDAEPRIYSFGLPIGAAVLLAALPVGIWWKFAVLLIAGVPVAIWGVSFDVLAHLVRSVPEWSATTLGQAGTMAVAIAYQFGSLVFPALVPTALAVGFSWDRLRRE